MWNIELSFIMAMNRASSISSSIARPNISHIRPPTSIFHPSCAISVFLQAIIHIASMSTGAQVAKVIMQQQQSSAIKDINGIATSDKRCGFQLLYRGWNLGTIQRHDEGVRGSNSSIGSGGGSLLGRKPFHPNPITNIVFLFSIFQNVVVSIVNHMGEPFNRNIFEHREFCLSAGASILFCLALVLEIFPDMNHLLELAPIRDKRARVAILLLFVVDFVGCYGVDRLSSKILDQYSIKKEESVVELSNRRRNKVSSKEKYKCASDLEEEVLSEERKENAAIIGGLSFIAIVWIGMSFLY